MRPGREEIKSNGRYSLSRQAAVAHRPPSTGHCPYTGTPRFPIQYEHTREKHDEQQPIPSLLSAWLSPGSLPSTLENHFALLPPRPPRLPRLPQPPRTPPSTPPAPPPTPPPSPPPSPPGAHPEVVFAVLPFLPRAALGSSPSIHPNILRVATGPNCQNERMNKKKYKQIPSMDSSIVGQFVAEKEQQHGPSHTTHTHTRAHTRTHARTHAHARAHTHTHTQQHSHRPPPPLTQIRIPATA